jgi:hypothetical protein
LGVGLAATPLGAVYKSEFVKEDKYQNNSNFIKIWKIFLFCNLLLSLLIIVELTFEEKAQKAIVSSMNPSEIQVTFDDDSWVRLKGNVEINKIIKISDTVRINSSPIFGLKKSYSIMPKFDKHYSNIGLNILFPIFLIFINIVAFLLFTFVPQFLDSDAQKMDSFYHSFIDIGTLSIADVGMFVFIFPVLLNLIYWYELWIYLF